MRFANGGAEFAEDDIALVLSHFKNPPERVLIITDHIAHGEHLNALGEQFSKRGILWDAASLTSGSDERAYRRDLNFKKDTNLYIGLEKVEAHRIYKKQHLTGLYRKKNIHRRVIRSNSNGTADLINARQDVDMLAQRLIQRLVK